MDASPHKLPAELVGPAGRIETLVDVPSGTPRAVAVIGHPHPQLGGTMRARPVHEMAKALARAGSVVVRFNFRGVGASQGAFDEGRGEMDDFRAVVEAAAAAYPDLPIWAAGYSFGAWIAMTCGAGDPRVRALIGVGLPLEGYDYSLVAASATPKFLVHGERDEVTSVQEIRRFYAGLAEPKELVEIDGAAHLFDGRTAELGEAVEGLLADFEE
ncbi:MAG: alpha/beta fold hydrolase [Acidobacteriota bacterium]